MQNIQRIIDDVQQTSKSELNIFPKKEVPVTEMGYLCATMGMVALQPAIKQTKEETDADLNFERINMF